MAERGSVGAKALELANLLKIFFSGFLLKTFFSSSETFFWKISHVNPASGAAIGDATTGNRLCASVLNFRRPGSAERSVSVTTHEMVFGNF